MLFERRWFVLDSDSTKAKNDNYTRNYIKLSIIQHLKEKHAHPSNNNKKWNNIIIIISDKTITAIKKKTWNLKSQPSSSGVYGLHLLQDSHVL